MDSRRIQHLGYHDGNSTIVSSTSFVINDTATSYDDITMAYFDDKSNIIVHTTNISAAEVIEGQLDPSYSNMLGVSFLVLSVVGSTCNGLIMLAVACSQSLWKPSYFYVFSACVADFLMCAVYCPFSAVATLGEEVPPGCYVMGILQNILVVSSLLSLAAVAVNRYLLVKMTPNQYLTIYSKRPLAMSILTVWAVGLFYALLIIGGASDARYDYVVGMCITLPTLTGLSLFTPLQVALVGLPSFITICYSYYHIWVIFRASQHRIQGKHAGNMAASFRLSRNLFIITTVYCVCWVPNLIVAAADPNYTAPDILHQVTALLALAHSMINPTLNLALNRPLTAALWQVLKGRDRPWRLVDSFRHSRLSTFHMGRQHASSYTPRPLAALVEEPEPRNPVAGSYPQLTAMLSHHVREMWAHHMPRTPHLSSSSTDSILMTPAVPWSPNDVTSSRSSPSGASTRSAGHKDKEDTISSVSTISDMSSAGLNTPSHNITPDSQQPLNAQHLLQNTGDWHPGPSEMSHGYVDLVTTQIVPIRRTPKGHQSTKL